MKNIGILMDPIESINITKDSSFSMIQEAQRRGYIVHYFTKNDLFFKNNTIFANTKIIVINKNLTPWFKFTKQITIDINQQLDLLLFRTDPPFDNTYLSLTYLLELAEIKGLTIVNSPLAIRNANEKLSALLFKDIYPDTIVTSNIAEIKKFIEQYKHIIVKPLNYMGGKMIFNLKLHDPNINVVLETITDYETKIIMAQRFLPEISSGDKRVLLINGEPVEYGLARIPSSDDFRGNLKAQASEKTFKLTEIEYELCAKVANYCKQNKLYFVGLDIIGKYITEINVTSPTCIQEIDNAFHINISSKLFDVFE